MTTTTSATISFELTKKQIIERLYTQGHITFNEMWTLILDEPEIQYVPMGTDPITIPSYPWNGPQYTVSNDSDNTRLHNTDGGTKHLGPR